MAYEYDIGNIFEQNGSYSVTFGKQGSDNYITEFFAKTKYDNPKKAAETFHKKIVDSGWSSASGKTQASPLKDAIRNAYKEIKKGKNTTTNDIYQKIKNLKVVKGKDKNTIFSAITKRLSKDKLPYKKGATIVIARRATEDARLKEKLKQKVNQPTLVTKDGGKIAGILYPKSGPKSKENFIKALREFDSTPKVQKGLARKLAQFRNKFFPEGITQDTLNKLLVAVRKEEKIPPRPTREPDADKVLRGSSVDKFSKKDVERILKKGKRTSTPGKVLDLAHKLSLATSRRFNIPQPTQSLALQKPFINRIIGTQYERKLNKLYELQNNLVKNKPDNYKVKIERLNKIITSVVNDADGRVIGVVIDEKTLKPRMYGNVESFKDTIDQGFFDKNVKNMTKDEAKLIVNNLYKDSVSLARGAGADISKLKNVNIEELKTAALKSKKLGGPNLKKALRELAKFPETTKAYGVVGTAMDKSIYKKIANVGCYDSLLAQGGRVGFATGANCFKKGVDAIESGNIKDGAQTRNFTKLMDSVKTGGARAATSFLNLIGLGKGEGVEVFRGERAGASGKMAKYIPGTSEVEFVPYSDKLKGRFYTANKNLAKQFADDPSKLKSLTIPQKDFNIGTKLARRINVDQMTDQLILPKTVMNKLKDGTLKYNSPAFRTILKTLGKGKVFAATTAVGVGAGALVKKFMSDDPSTYLTNDAQANAMILDTIDQKEREERMEAIGDAPELLDEAAIGAEVGAMGAAIPGASAVYQARKKPFTRIVDGVKKTRPAMGTARAALGPVGKALSGFATPLGIAAITPLNVASSLYEGDSAYEVATDPVNYLGPAFAGSLSKEATRGMGATSKLARSLRLGMSPGAIKMVSRRFGIPGLALSAGISLYELADDYKMKRGLFGKQE